MSPKSTYDYLILGSGRQGTAAAYDLARFGRAGRIFLADASLDAARQAAERVNALRTRQICHPIRVDVSSPQALRAALQPVDGALSAVPYRFNPEITQAAIDTATHLCDLGGNTELVLAQLALDTSARTAGISIVPDCGMGPGLINTLGAYAVELLDKAESVHIYDAGLPQQPEPPWNYALTFHINGLTNEMDGEAVFLRQGKLTRVPTLTEPELLEIPPFGLLEADVTSGGTSTAPWSFEGILRTYENKVLRYPGHYEWLRAYKALGLFSESPVSVNGSQVAPRELYHKLLEPKLTRPLVKDVCVIRVIGSGTKGDRPACVVIDLLDYYDEATGFTAMERLTGFHCAIMLAFQVSGQVPAGVVPVERAVAGSRFVAELPARGIPVRVAWEESRGDAAPASF